MPPLYTTIQDQFFVSALMFPRGRVLHQGPDPASVSVQLSLQNSRRGMMMLFKLNVEQVFAFIVGAVFYACSDICYCAYAAKYHTQAPN